MKRIAWAVAAALFLSACAQTSVTSPPVGPAIMPPFPALAEVAPEATPQTVARGPLVAAANPLAAEAGMAVLRRGGSAVDAAVAIQAVLSLVEPQSSGLGGGAFLMHYDAETGAVTAYDGRETAPATAGPELFFENGRPLGFVDAVLSGRSTGAPGAVAVLGLAQSEHGRLGWNQLFDDAERLARDGFAVSPRMAGMINLPASRGPQAHTPAATAYFTRPDGQRYQAGDILRNPEYARTVRELADGGPRVFYEGRIAQEIVAAVGADPRPGGLTLADIAAYRPVKREAICGPFRGHVVCVPPPPSSGVAVIQALAMAEDTPDILLGANDPRAWVAFGRIQRLMYADRDRYVGDADFVSVPIAGLLDPAYVAERAALVPTVNGPVEAGTPPGAPVSGADATREPAGTTHFIVIDQWGDAVSMTTTVESLFGSGRMAGGFFLNNQLTDFSLNPVDDQGRPVANAPAAGKRPRSSMSPALILTPDGRLEGAVGSPGGNSILAYNLKALFGVLAWNLTMQAAIDEPNLVVRGSSIGADTELFDAATQEALAAAGMPLSPNASETSGLHGAIWRGDHWDAGADPRREGVALQ